MRKKQNIIKDKTVSSRSAVLFFVFILIFGIIIFKLAYLQLYSKNKYRVEEFKDSMSYTVLEAKRGTIYDRDANTLAKSINVYNGYFSTYDYNLYKKYDEKLKTKETQKLDKIFELLQLNKEEVFSKAEEYNNLLIKTELTEEDKALVKGQNTFLLNISNNNLYFSILEYDKFKKYSEKAKLSEEKKIDTIFEKFEIDKEKVFNRAESGTNFKIKKSISPDVAKEIKELKSSIISIEIEQSRTYIDSNFAPFIVGHVNDNGGQTGVENSFNDLLAGTSGRKRIIRENLSKTVEDVVPAVDGKDLYLTIDSTIQGIISKYGQEYYDKERPIKLNIIVSDVNTGDILAMENFPKYDLNYPNELNKIETESNKENKNNEKEKSENDLNKTENSDTKTETSKSDENKELSEKEKLEKIFAMWKNTSVSDSYEPGSVFKLITGAASLEEHTDTLDSTFYCNGFVRDIPGIVLKCFNWQNPHGTQTFTKAMDNSCNPAFVQMARNLGRDKLYRYVKGFGFGTPTGIDLPGESSGQIPKTLQDIGSAELATMSYGHGVSTSPLQMMMAANAVVNGGYLLAPQISLKNVEKLEDGTVNIKENEPIVKNQIISKETSDKMRVVMEHGVEEGIVNRVASNSVRIGAKSGTTLKVINGEYSDTKVFASVYAAFPIENPKYSVMVVFDEPQSGGTGSTASGPLAKKIIEAIVGYKNIVSEKNENETLIRNTTVPEVTGLSFEYASEILESKYLKYKVNTEASPKGIVINQGDYAGKTLREGSEVELTLSDDPKYKLLVLDFSNMTYNKVMDIVSKMGYKYKTEGGKGKFKSSNKSSGDYISKDEELILTFED
ncbi:MAG: penicillin-binding transpeptidase domain-containing protein [Peptoniphilaceae bacterium]|uniref:penicillin-binding transpeptidase domain-containing protein n=1 Tax=Parvimonas sp. TaxID=1944660 RepID=UPI0025F78355|nr:penicillin-binding transpeptidase domain-containing protein [Parvimonas sp.]MCI5997976.1 PASTA domain-containing protein [Parvimonas sp.]MDD7765096.1 penicillin-binding transpeptidase domain-containing protein [Peptoniphilaceae bacterium]MDY3051466.1 penicillin-binding transpeptidase domain-containing protein [Parvimonas sp.]